MSRSDFQEELKILNPIFAEWSERNRDRNQLDVASSVNPDGDVDLMLDYSLFKYPTCPSCPSGMMKPSLVFFGENITHTVRDNAFSMVDNASALLAVGTSLQVFSAFRLLRRIKESGPPGRKIMILNMGETRGDALADERISAGSSAVLAEVLEIVSR
ncbi:NAD-dependent protein lipoamidase sirtuin-4 [Rhizophlyctis rosea]|uniref:NAD-dependent protein lipoamidase sirtuin-4 n=1 Tax=Rhizophlyctis rosea TaxID=64517 RepID=A0AAD5SKI8_9FUNG|nr:NAD-dependent protein lipoamidase sirtuin-4 [Rhizophlyctis rosea]